MLSNLDSNVLKSLGQKVFIGGGSITAAAGQNPWVKISSGNNPPSSNKKVFIWKIILSSPTTQIIRYAGPGLSGTLAGTDTLFCLNSDFTGTPNTQLTSFSQAGLPGTFVNISLTANVNFVLDLTFPIILTNTFSSGSNLSIAGVTVATTLNYTFIVSEE